jgi:hypothetical protein
MRLAPPIFIFFFTFCRCVEAPGVMFVLVAFAPTFHNRIKTNGILGKSGTFDFFFFLRRDLFRFHFVPVVFPSIESYRDFIGYYQLDVCISTNDTTR